MTKGKLETANRAELIALIETQQQIIVELRAEIKRLKERETVPEGKQSGDKGDSESSAPVWVKPKRRERTCPTQAGCRIQATQEVQGGLCAQAQQAHATCVSCG